MTSIAWQSIIAVECLIILQLVQALIEIYDPFYMASGWKSTLIAMAAVALVAAFDIFAAEHLRIAEGVFATCGVFAYVPFVVLLWVLVSPKSSASEVFGHFRDSTGTWPTAGLSALVGQTTGMFVNARSDALAHLAEEVEDAAVVVPEGMLWSYLLSAPFTLIVLLTYCFNIGSVSGASLSRQPFVYALQNALPDPGATTGCVVIILVLIFMVTISSLASASRQTFAFARDNGLPFSKYLRNISQRYHVPVNSVVLSMVVTAFLSLLNLSSEVALTVVMALSTASLMGSYGLSIGCIALRRFKHQPIPRCRWSLGSAGLPINCLAVVYTAWGFFWSFWPIDCMGQARTFNWTFVLFFGIMGVATLLYGASAKKKYRAPVSTVQHWMNEW